MHKRHAMLLVSLLLLSSAAPAALITYDFSVEAAGGSLNAVTYTGSLSYELPEPAPSPLESLLLTDFSFNFLDSAGANHTYTLVDDFDPSAPDSGPTAYFDAGIFIGFSYVSSNSVVSFAPGFRDASDPASSYPPSFFYDLGNGNMGTGTSPTFTLAVNGTVPEPPTWLNLMLGAALLAAASRRPASRRGSTS